MFLLVVFSWGLPVVVALAQRGQCQGCEVHVGGPAAEYTAEWAWEQAWTSKGCANRCSFCIVARLVRGMNLDYTWCIA